MCVYEVVGAYVGVSVAVGWDLGACVCSLSVIAGMREVVCMHV